MSRERIALFPDAERPIVFGHRGYSAEAPENTLAAFRLLLARGVPGVELDVHRCATGELVVIHDYELSRLTGEGGLVEEHSLQELRRRSAGAWFSREFESERVPLLTEVFALLGDRVYYDIELKHEDREPSGMEEPLARLIDEFGLEKRTMVSSFNPYPVKRFAELQTGIPTAVIYSNSRSVPRLMRNGQGRFIARCDVLKPNRRKVNAVTRFWYNRIEGYPLVPWTVNTHEEVDRLLALEVAGLVSDDPGMVMNRVAAHRTTSSAAG